MWLHWLAILCHTHFVGCGLSKMEELICAQKSKGREGEGDFELDPQRVADVQAKLLKKTSSLLEHILGGLSTASKAKTDSPDLLLEATSQFHTVLGEIDAIRESSGHDSDILLSLATCAANEEAVLEMVCDFLFRMTKREIWKLHCKTWYRNHCNSDQGGVAH